MHLAATRFPTIRAGFLHVPYLPSQAARLPGTPSMALDQIVCGIEIILSVTATRRDDIREAGFGTLA
jgi:pyroglutamyl-peptidase